MASSAPARVEPSNRGRDGDRPDEDGFAEDGRVMKYASDVPISTKDDEERRGLLCSTLMRRAAERAL
jgi:hypothetical protein